MEAIEMLNKKYGRLLVIGIKKKIIQGKNRTNHRIYLLCRCACGTEKYIRKDILLNGHTVSCGCNKREKAHFSGLKHAQSCITHNMSKSRIYKIWRSMKSRCNLESCGGYKNYGGRGIKVCDEWESDFMNFYKWAVQNGYKDNLSIDRINVNGNYEPSNCRWITFLEQQNNKTTNHFITYKNKTLTLSQWARELKIPISTIFNRLKKNYSLEKVFNK